mmetsp:Transcript_26583/g.82173  ORF Transcript_26583/g.82173 Transcript_26583/m.82173 type:complete len:229 (+) Transcript_26583:1546-2232(+)
MTSSARRFGNSGAMSTLPRPAPCKSRSRNPTQQSDSRSKRKSGCSVPVGRWTYSSTTPRARNCPTGPLSSEDSVSGLPCTEVRRSSKKLLFLWALAPAAPRTSARPSRSSCIWLRSAAEGRSSRPRQYGIASATPCRPSGLLRSQSSVNIASLSPRVAPTVVQTPSRLLKQSRCTSSFHSRWRAARSLAKAPWTVRCLLAASEFRHISARWPGQLSGPKCQLCDRERT